MDPEGSESEEDGVGGLFDTGFEVGDVRGEELQKELEESREQNSRAGSRPRSLSSHSRGGESPGGAPEG